MPVDGVVPNNIAPLAEQKGKTGKRDQNPAKETALAPVFTPIQGFSPFQLSLKTG